MTNSLQEWMDGYRRAWESNDPNDIGALFTEDAVYFTEPFTPPSRGLKAIIATWLDKRDEPGDTIFEWSPLIVTDALAIVTGETVYKDGPTYSNLWVIRFAPSGKATEFTEWCMDHGRV
jgi:ketosteroid isomerase-like protein